MTAPITKAEHETTPEKPSLGFFFAVTIGLLVELVVCVVIVALYVLA
jgi:hypothetical protein